MLSDTDMVLRLAGAALLGALIGLERERLAWAAGLRTHMLVSLGAALLMIVSSFGFEDVRGHEHVVLDPSRVAAQVVSGIGFIGGGTILFLRRQVIRGLTTAASLWAVAAVGLAVGGGLYVAAGAATAIALVILAVLKPLERRLHGTLYTREATPRRRQLNLLVAPHPQALARIEAAVHGQGLQVRSISVRREAQDGLDAVSLVLEDEAAGRAAAQGAAQGAAEDETPANGGRDDKGLGLVAALREQDGVKEVRM